MSASSNVFEEKKPWWKMYGLKIVIAVLLAIIIIILVIWFITKTRTVPSRKTS